jgi:hypothetical protein
MALTVTQPSMIQSAKLIFNAVVMARVFLLDLLGLDATNAAHSAKKFRQEKPAASLRFIAHSGQF